MFLDKIKRKNESEKKRERVFFLTKKPEDFSAIDESLSLYGLEVINNHIKTNELLDKLNSMPASKSYFIIDGEDYQESEIAEIAMILRGRYPAILIGTEDSVAAIFIAREGGFTNYFVRSSEPRYLVSEIVKYFGYTRSRTSLIIGICNTSPDAALGYKVFEDLRTSEIMKGYSALFINCDINNIFYDAALGVKANRKATELALSQDTEVDTSSSIKLMTHISEQFDYLSFNVLAEGIKMSNSEYLIKRIEAVLDSVGNSYGFIFINLPYYLMMFPTAMKMLKSSDVRLLLTNGSIESVYNVNHIRNEINFKNDIASKKRDKLVAIRINEPFNGLNANNITDGEILNKLGLTVDHSTTKSPKKKILSFFQNIKSNENIIDIIIR